MIGEAVRCMTERWESMNWPQREAIYVYVSNQFMSNLFKWKKESKLESKLKSLLMKRCVSEKMWELETCVSDKAC